MTAYIGWIQPGYAEFKGSVLRAYDRARSTTLLRLRDFPFGLGPKPIPQLTKSDRHERKSIVLNAPPNPVNANKSQSHTGHSPAHWSDSHIVLQGQTVLYTFQLQKPTRNAILYSSTLDPLEVTVDLMSGLSFLFLSFFGYCICLLKPYFWVPFSKHHYGPNSK